MIVVMAVTRITIPSVKSGLNPVYRHNSSVQMISAYLLKRHVTIMMIVEISRTKRAVIRASVPEKIRADVSITVQLLQPEVTFVSVPEDIASHTIVLNCVKM